MSRFNCTWLHTCEIKNDDRHSSHAYSMNFGQLIRQEPSVISILLLHFMLLRYSFCFLHRNLPIVDMHLWYVLWYFFTTVFHVIICHCCVFRYLYFQTLFLVFLPSPGFPLEKKQYIFNDDTSLHEYRKYIFNENGAPQWTTKKHWNSRLGYLNLLISDSNTDMQ